MAQNHYHLEIESDPKNLITLEEFVNYFAVDLQLGEDKISALLLAMTEAGTNAIKHGNKCDPNKIVTIDVYIEENTIKIVVKDEGEGFDPKEIPDPTEPENLLKDSGRGLFLMKVYMKELAYNMTPTGMEAIIKLDLN